MISKDFEPVRTFNGLRYIYYQKYPSKKHAKLKANHIVREKKGLVRVLKIVGTNNYALFIHWGKR